MRSGEARGNTFTIGHIAAIVGCSALALPLSLRRPEVTISLFALAAVFTWSWPEWLRTSANVVYWALVLALAVAGLRFAWRNPAARYWMAGAALVCVGLATSALWSVDPQQTLAEVIRFGVVLAVVAFAGSLVASSLRRAESLARALAPLAPLVLAATAAVVVLGIWDEELAGDGTKSGVFDGPNILGAVLALGLPFFLTLRRLWDSWALSLALVVLVAFVTYASGSRTGFVAIALGVGVLELGCRRWRRLASEFAALATVVALFAVANVPDTPALGRPLQQGAPAQNEVLLGTDRPPGQSRFSALVGARDEGWREAIRIVGFRPIAGHGFGTGAELFERYDSADRFRYFVGAFTATSTHSGYLQALTEVGVVGALPLFLLAAATALFTARGVIRRWRSASAAAFGAATSAALFVALFESTFWQAGPLTLLSWLAFTGVLGTWLRRSLPPRPAPPPSGD